MGKVITKIKLTNYNDLARAKAGDISADKVRSIVTEGLVDTGATYLCLPEEIVDQLGLDIVKEVTANYADGSKKKKKIADGILIEFSDFDRDATVRCVVENRGTQILIGQIPLEYTDLHVNCVKEKLQVNPESPDMPLVEIF